MLVFSTSSFNRDISKLKDGRITLQLHRIIQKMQEVDNISELGGVKKLAGSNNAYRIRIADYRLGFRVNNNQIELVIFANRKDVYKYFP